MWSGGKPKEFEMADSYALNNVRGKDNIDLSDCWFTTTLSPF